MKLINFKIDEELHEQFKKSCEEQGVKMSTILRVMIEDFVYNDRLVEIKIISKDVHIYPHPTTGQPVDRYEFCETCQKLMNTYNNSCEICKCTECPAHQ